MHFLKHLPLLVLVMVSLALFGCGGTESSSSEEETQTTTDPQPTDGTGEEEASESEEIEEILESTTQVSALLQSIFQGDVSEEEACEGGSVDVETDPTQTTDGVEFTMDATFDECDGVDGDLTVEGSVENSGEASITMNGTLTITDEEGETCTTSYDDFTSTLTSEELTYNGSISATCTDEGESITVNCTYDDLTLDAETSEEELAAALATSCSIE